MKKNSYSIIYRILIAISLIISVFGKLEMNGTLLKCSSETTMMDKIPLLRHKVIDCKRKIRIMITIYNEKKLPSDIEYLLLDKIYDSESGTMVQLMNPITVMMKREPLTLAYPFLYSSSVNAKVSETVINKKNRKNFTGCIDTNVVHATCGVKTENGVIVPFSQGFCCSCKEVNEIIHPRGGQDCSINVPKNEEEMHFTSAHCLHFDKTWYTVSTLLKPVIKHNVYIQIFVRYDDNETYHYWTDITKDLSFTIGPDNPYQFNNDKSIVAAYITENPNPSDVNIKYLDKFLLMPQEVPNTDLKFLPQAVKNGATDYLLLNKDIVKPDGSECNTAGTSYEAFAKQGKRCQAPANTCLKNQPFDLWKEDDRKRKSGKKGSYMLQFYGEPNEDPILFNKTSGEHWLSLKYFNYHVSFVYIEMDAKSIVVLRMGKHAQLTSVVTVTFNTNSEVIIYLTNIGLVPSRFVVKINKCDKEISDSTEMSQLVSPQVTSVYNLSINFKTFQETKIITCIVEASSAQLGIVAMRKISFKPMQKCFCQLHCECGCSGEYADLSCYAMKLSEFHLAGFRGSIPLIVYSPSVELWKSSILLITLICMMIFGGIKAFLGLCYHKSFEEFGLSALIYRKKHLAYYYEPDLRKEPVEYNNDGYPINPKTKEKARTIPNWTIFCLNILFFLLSPILLFLIIFQLLKNKKYLPVSNQKQ